MYMVEFFSMEDASSQSTHRPNNVLTFTICFIMLSGNEWLISGDRCTDGVITAPLPIQNNRCVQHYKETCKSMPNLLSHFMALNTITDYSCS